MLAVCCLGWAAVVEAQPPAPGNATVAAPSPTLCIPPVDFIPNGYPCVNQAPCPAQQPAEPTGPRVSLGFEYIMR